MTVLHIEHPVPSYEGWKKVFDSDPVNRKKSGVKRYRIYRALHDINYVVVDLEFDNLSDAEEMLKALQKLWPKVEGSIMNTPKAQILNVVESTDL
jgi:hypothetical protein